LKFALSVSAYVKKRNEFKVRYNVLLLGFGAGLGQREVPSNLTVKKKLTFSFLV